jgi:hypothetical protein
VTFYSKLTADQVSSTYQLFKMLQRLRVIGHLSAHTEKAVEDGGDVFGDYTIHDFTGADYSVVKDGYSSDKTKICQEELLEKVFGRISRRHHLRGTD